MPQGAKGKLIRRGYELLNNTCETLGPGAKDPSKAYAGNGLACRSCHQFVGVKPYGLPWVGVANRYPRYHSRSGRDITLTDRINGCFERSMNGKPLPPDSEEMKAMLAYMQWLTDGFPKKIVGTGSTGIEVPDRAVDLKQGEAVYTVACQSCHGPDGKGYRPLSVGEQGAYAVPPVWGPDSYNTGAGMHRVLSAAGFIRSNMPLGTPWNRPFLTDEQAFDVAGYINSKPRPQKADTDKDWPNKAEKPVDCPYPPYADGFSQKQHKYGPFPPIIKAKAQQQKKK